MAGTETKYDCEVLNRSAIDRQYTNNANICIALILAVLACAFAAATPARAETATFSEPAVVDERDRAALSTQGDNAGYLLGLGDTIGIVFDTPLDLSRGDRISIFSLPPQTGAARAQIRFGSYNNGSPIILATRNFRAGNTRNLRISGGLLSGCQLLGGCDYIEIVTTRTRGGAAGVEIDYILVDGRLVEVTTAQPEPQTWALMIIAFLLVAARLKSRRAQLISQRSPPVARQARRIHPWQATTAPQIVHP